MTVPPTTVYCIFPPLTRVLEQEQKHSSYVQTLSRFNSVWKKSFGGISNSNILMPWLTTVHGAYVLHSGVAHVDNVITSQCSKKYRAAPIKANDSELSGTFGALPPEPAPHIPELSELSGTHTLELRNLPEPCSGTCSCDPHRHTPEFMWA